MMLNSFKKIRVLVADDSALMRLRISDILNSAPEIEVIATARDGEDAIRKVTEFRPDVVTLDVEMPRLDGLGTLGYIMSEVPTPVVMVSAYTQRGAEATFLALKYGAIDFVPKPSGVISRDIRKVEEELVAKVKIAARVDLRKLKFILPKKAFKKPSKVKPIIGGEKVVAIGASTGGPRALTQVLTRLPSNFSAALLVVQHMPERFTKTFAQRLNTESRITVKEAEEDDSIIPGQALIAPGNYHLVVESKGSRKAVGLNQNPSLHGVRPSVDVMMLSVAEVYGPNAVGVILTGMGSDGAQGMRAIKEKKGKTIAQDKDSCVIYGMPQAAIKQGSVDKVTSLNRIADVIMRVL
jgi:two-component system chemotaxis response regulator CheB